MAENGGRTGSVFTSWPPKRPPLYRILKDNNNMHPVTQLIPQLSALSTGAAQK